MILDLIAEAPDDDRVLQDIAAGRLEGFLGRFDAEVIDRVETEAARDPRFRRVLSGVWKHAMSDPVWSRVRAIQATVPDPLPEMRPLGAGETTRPEGGPGREATTGAPSAGHFPILPRRIGTSAWPLNPG